MHLARLICQRSNIYWDSELRRSYVDWITGLGLLISISTVIVGIALKMNLEIFVLSLLAPISPTLLWCIREANKQRESATTLDRLIKYSQQLWVDSLSDKVSTDEITERSRRLQDELFVHRYSNQPIFNWINNMLQQKYEAQMNLGAEELVACALKKDNR